jgi:ABC-2 type transport system permease protein
MNARFHFRVFLGSFKYSLTQTLRYLSAGWFLGLYVLGPIFFLLTSWTIVKILGNSYISNFQATSGFVDYMPFAIVGFAFQGVIMATAFSGANAIRSEQEFGTLEAVFVTPSSKVAWLGGKISATLVLALVSAALVLAVSIAAFPFMLNLHPDIPAAIFGTLLSVIGMGAFSFALAGLTFLVKRGADVTQVLWPSMVFFTGLAFPTEALPGWAQFISQVFPITPGLAITRSAVLNGVSILNPTLGEPLVRIMLLTSVYVPTGYVSFKILFKRALRTGALATY